MPRRVFPAGTVTNTTGAPLRLTFYPTSTSGHPEIDLSTVDGSNNLVLGIYQGIILTDTSGAYSAFAGPDDVDTLYVDANNGTSRTTITATGYVSSSVIDAGLTSTYATIVNAPANGVTDASPAIQAHLDAAAALGIKTVIIPPSAGTYLLGTQLAAENVTIQAYGASFKMANGSAGAALTTKNQTKCVLAPLVTVTTNSTTGGSLAAGAQYWVVTAVTASGETPASLLKTATTTGSTSSVVLTWTAPTVPAGAPAITGYRIYGRTQGALVRIGSTAAGVTTFTDTGAAGTGEALPVGNATLSRTTRLAVFGGTWDINGSNRPADIDWVTSGKTAGHGFDLQKVDDIVIRDVTINNASCFAIAVADWGHLVTENIHLATLRDGIHVLGPGLTWTGRAIKGSTGDDMLAISLGEWDWMAVSAGSVDKVVLEDVYANSTGVPAFLRILGARGYKLGQFTMRNVRGTWKSQSNFSAALRAEDNQVGTHQIYPDGTDIDSLSIRDVNIRLQNPGSASGKPLVKIAGRFVTAVDVDGISCLTTTAQDAVQVTNATGAGTTCTITDLRLGGLYRATSGRLALTLDSASTITNTRINEVTTVETYATAGTFTWTKFPGAKTVEFRGWGPGGSSGSGRRGAAGTVRCGGGGGGSGGYFREIFPASVLPSSMTLIVGAAGTAGAAVTTDDTDGHGAGSGSATEVRDNAGSAAASTIRFGGAPGLPGSGGTNATGTAGNGGSGYTANGVAGGAASTTGGVGSTGATGTGGTASGGGPGGGITSGDSPSNGAPGGATWLTNDSAVGTTPGGSATAATHTNASQAGLGGAGGAGSITGAGGAGAPGAGAGAPGGGGGASLNGNASGAGGVGQPGAIQVITTF